MLLPPHPGVALFDGRCYRSSACVLPRSLSGTFAGSQLCFSESHASGLTLLGEVPSWLKCHDPAVFLSETVTRTSYKLQNFLVQHRDKKLLKHVSLYYQFIATEK